MSKPTKKPMNFLAKHLRKAAGHLGRTNPELVRIAAETGLSVHTIQSMAMGRKIISDARRVDIKQAIG